jgi:hypothetical protein
MANSDTCTETISLYLHRSKSTRSQLVTSADPDDFGSEQYWAIQLIWSIYYAAGTLVYTSIMAVTVIELVVWVLVCCFAVGTSKLLAFRLAGNWA